VLISAVLPGHATRPQSAGATVHGTMPGLIDSADLSTSAEAKVIATRPNDEERVTEVVLAPVL
jgi:hypothetical protein